MHTRSPTATTQRGASTLLMALVLMVALTIVTLSTARALVNEARGNAGQAWHARLFSRAEATLEEVLAALPRRTDWQAVPGSSPPVQTATRNLVADGIETRLELSRTVRPPYFIDIAVSARLADSPGLVVRIQQQARAFGILTPLAERAPPLILGRDDDLHAVLFSVDRKTLRTLADKDRALPEAQRRYWLADDTELAKHGWSRSLGTPQHHVLLYFPGGAGCPRFADGVRIYGFVFVEAPCDAPLSAGRLEIFGTLAIAGHGRPEGGDIRLGSLQSVPGATAWPDFPPLKTVRVPGSWRDF